MLFLSYMMHNISLAQYIIGDTTSAILEPLSGCKKTQLEAYLKEIQLELYPFFHQQLGF